jgi:L-threonylcarbamoyladenylate synthase
VILLPTETVYGLATFPLNVARLFEIKERPRERSVQLLAPDASWLDRLGRPSDVARRLAAAFWPGPLTLVVGVGDAAPPELLTTLAGDGTIGIRVPDHDLALAVLGRCGPLAASSANLSGEPTPSTAAEIADLFGDRVDAYLDGGTIEGTGSTVVDVSGADLRVLRPGPIPAADLERAATGPI